MPDSKHKTFAVVGFGHIGRRNTTIVNGYENTEVIAIVDINEEVFNHELFPKNIPHFKTREEVYQSGLKPVVVNISIPNGTHCALALQALKLGTPCSD
jgi:predicted dehydrogenase